ncbi:MAG: RluA family pseudouridine synthase [Thermoplasmata archaeon]
MVRSQFPSTVTMDSSGLPLIEFLSRRFRHITRQEWQRRICEGLVTSSGRMLCSDEVLPAGAVINYYKECVPPIPLPDAEKINVPIIYNKNDVLIIDKPPKLPVMPSGFYLDFNLVDILRKRNKDILFLVPITRLDKDASGLVLCATSRKAASFLHRQVKYGYVEKLYIAGVKDWKYPLPAVIDAPLKKNKTGKEFYLSRVSSDGKSAITEVLGSFNEKCNDNTAITEVLFQYCKDLRSIPDENAYRIVYNKGTSYNSESLSLNDDKISGTVIGNSSPAVIPDNDDDALLTKQTYLILRPRTGRPHQIRVHLAFAGHPLDGDTLYNPIYIDYRYEAETPRLLLHCCYLRFELPDNRGYLEFYSMPDFIKT